MMQDPISSFHSIEDCNLQQQHLIKCPRCESANTKFCYYNNYNLSQPRHFCKNCRRYWTKGGTLRNIPVGGGSRKNSKRPSSSDSSSDSNTFSSSNPKRSRDPKAEPVSAVAAAYPNQTAEAATAEDNMLEISGTFSSLLQSNGQFGNFLDGFGSDANPDNVAGPNHQQQQQGEGLLGWVGGWPELAIYTSPGSSFQ